MSNVVRVCVCVCTAGGVSVASQLPGSDPLPPFDRHEELGGNEVVLRDERWAERGAEASNWASVLLQLAVDGRESSVGRRERPAVARWAERRSRACRLGSGYGLAFPL